VISGKAAKKAAKAGAAGAEARDASANLGFGNTTVSADGTITQEDNQFTDLSRLFAGEAANQLDQSKAQLIDPTATGITQSSVGDINRQIGNQFGVLQGAIGAQPQFDPTAFAQTQFDRLQSLASRGEEIAANRVAGGLFSRGRLGGNDSATGAAFEGLARAQGDARTQRALQATQLANQEAQRLFGQSQVGIQNQFGLLGQLFNQGQNQFGNLLQQGGFNQAFSQQSLQNALGLGTGAGQVLNPNFQTLTAVLNRQATDQASRAGVSADVAGIIQQGGQGTADAIGNAFAGIGQAVTNRTT
jgi:hypothetical protein